MIVYSVTTSWIADIAAVLGHSIVR